MPKQTLYFLSFLAFGRRLKMFVIIRKKMVKRNLEKKKVFKSVTTIETKSLAEMEKKQGESIYLFFLTS